MAGKDDSNETVQFEDHVFTKTFRQQMVQLWKAKQHTDVILKAGGVELHCHQVALSAGSLYFNAMFTSDCTESKSGVVETCDISSDALESIIDYIYTGQIQITTENAQQLVQASDLYHLDNLKKTCETFMVDQLEAQNCLGFNRFAQIYRLNDLTKESRYYVLNHFKDCVLGPEFKELTEEELVEYIKDDHLDVNEEEQVFEAVLDWVKHEVDGRSNKLLSILQHVRAYYCTSSYLSHIVKEELFAKDPDLINYIHRLWQNQAKSEGANLMPRRSYPVKQFLLLVRGLGKGGQCISDQHCYYFNEDDQSWDRLARLPSAGNSSFSVCKFNKTVLMTGGNESSKSCWILDNISLEWKQLSSMKEGRYYHGSIEQGSKAYVIGGTTMTQGQGEKEARLTSSVEIFHSNRNKWLPTQSLITAVHSPIIVAHCSRHIYCFGGSTDVAGRKHSRHTQVYDTLWERWSERAEMPQICSFGSAATVAEKIFVLGGYSKSCMSYSPDTDQWSLLTQPSAKHGYAPATVWREKILVSGGYEDHMVPTSLIEEYDPDTDTWTKWGSPLEKEQGCHYLLAIEISSLTD